MSIWIKDAYSKTPSAQATFYFLVLCLLPFKVLQCLDPPQPYLGLHSNQELHVFHGIQRLLLHVLSLHDPL